jgi:hypothetical protein
MLLVSPHPSFEAVYPESSVPDAQDRLHRIGAIYWHDTVDADHVYPCNLINRIDEMRNWSCAEYGFDLSDYEAEMEEEESAAR